MTAVASAKWSAEEIDRLRELLGTMPHAQIAVKLGRTASAVKGAAKRFGLVTSRRWSDHDMAFLQANASGMTDTQIGAQIGKPAYCVSGMRRKLGLHRYRHASFGADFEAYLRQKHAAGWSDQEISQGWRCDRHAVTFRRKRLGLPSNLGSEHLRNRVRSKTREQLAAQGLENLAQLRSKVHRDRAIAAGWPEDLPLRSTQILNLLWDRGPMTRRQICEALGMKWIGSRTMMLDNGAKTSYLGALMRRGFVVSLGRCVQGGGPSKNVYLYSLPLWIERKETSHVQE